VPLAAEQLRMPLGGTHALLVPLLAANAQQKN